MPDLTWLPIGKSLVVGPSELDSYRDAADRLGIVLHWSAVPEWGEGAMRGTRVE